MAIHSKHLKIDTNQSRVTFTGNIGATDLRLTRTDGTTWDPSFTKIEAVYNFSGGNVTFAGFTFAPGTWKFAETGGLTITAQTGAISGNNNCMITLRS